MVIDTSMKIHLSNIIEIVDPTKDILDFDTVQFAASTTGNGNNAINTKANINIIVLIILCFFLLLLIISSFNS